MGSRVGDVVADLFGGSGSTLLACERRQRKARLMEIDPQYTDVILQRWQQYTGQEAILDGDGRSYAEMTRVRGAVDTTRSAGDGDQTPVERSRHE